jgi:hypothetical protein
MAVFAVGIKRRSNMKFSLGVLLFIVSLVLYQLALGDWSADAIFLFIDGTAILLHLLVVSAVVLVSDGRKHLSLGIRAAFSKKREFSREDALAALGFYKLLRRTFLCTGVLSFLIGIALLFSAPSLRGVVDDPISIAVGLSASVIGLLYAVIINTIFTNPIANILEKRSPLAPDPGEGAH